MHSLCVHAHTLCDCTDKSTPKTEMKKEIAVEFTATCKGALKNKKEISSELQSQESS